MPAHQKPSRDVAAEITSLIIAKLEQGVAPWRRPWNVAGGGLRPLRHCGTPYTGINTLFLWALGDAMGFSSRFWMTYRQAEALGAHVRKGERGGLSIFYSSVTKAGTDADTGEATEKNVRFLRHYTVFNADQIDQLPPHFYASPPETGPVVPSERQAAIDAFFDPIPVEVRHGGKRAYFDRALDYIQLPDQAAFHSMDHYASTRLHETVHWSGHPSRLARTFGERFGDKAYAFEELVAEIGAGLGCAELGLPNELHDSHASYLGHWLGILKADKTAIIHAASKAEQAFTLLRSFSDTVTADDAEHRHELQEAA